VQTPEAQASPDAQSLLTEHSHCTVVWVAMHTALGPHCASVVHSAHDPFVQTWPAGHWMFDVQLQSLPCTQAQLGLPHDLHTKYESQR
jgi:hypothetical protein